MEQKFIINNIPFMLELGYMHIENLLVDVTCVEDSWRNYVASGISYIEIEGIAKDDTKIIGKFQIVDKADGVFILKSVSD